MKVRNMNFLVFVLMVVTLSSCGKIDRGADENQKLDFGYASSEEIKHHLKIHELGPKEIKGGPIKFFVKPEPSEARPIIVKPEKTIRVINLPVKEKTDSKDIEPLIRQLKFTAAASTKNHQTYFEMEIKNTGNEVIELEYGSSQKFDIIVSGSDTGKKLYHFSQDRVFLTVITHEMISPGETITWRDTWPHPELLESGNYEVTMMLTPGKINQQRILNTPFVKQTTISIP
ncbi:MAG: hypothetical protein H0Z32_07320 [Bacillaceae bacterium]|nr:hypothetical protein [Bacillaceae bacterium]